VKVPISLLSKRVLLKPVTYCPRRVLALSEEAYIDVEAEEFKFFARKALVGNIAKQ
jgi:hypothetical protein